MCDIYPWAMRTRFVSFCFLPIDSRFEMFRSGRVLKNSLDKSDSIPLWRSAVTDLPDAKLRTIPEHLNHVMGRRLITQSEHGTKRSWTELTLQPLTKDFNLIGALL